MKKSLSVISAATLALAVGANSIDWSFSDVTVPSSTDNAQWQYVFLTYTDAADPTTWRMDGSNSDYDSATSGTTVDAAGTWNDNAASTQSYVIALWDGVTQTGNRFYAYQKDGSYVTVTASDLLGVPGQSAGLPGSASSVVEQIASGTGDYAGATLSSTAVVPEPGTAALALAGLALMIRRRK